jgi:hypothetical protein
MLCYNNVDLCRCLCHHNPDMIKHCVPCCSICPVCKQNIKHFAWEEHKKKCKRPVISLEEALNMDCPFKDDGTQL